MKERVNFSKESKMYIACDNDDLMSWIEYVFFKDGYMYATNAHVIVRNKISECSNLSEDDIYRLNGKCLHRNVYKNILTYDFIKVEDDGIRCQKGFESCFFQFGNVEKYPNIESTVREVLSKKPISTNEVYINPRSLNIASKCIPHIDGMKFMFVGDGHVENIIIRDLDEMADCVAIVMPLYHG